MPGSSGVQVRDLTGAQATPDQAVSASASAFDLNQLLSGLAPSTDYYYRAVAENSGGIVQGTIVHVATAASVSLPDLVATSFYDRTFYATGYPLDYSVQVTNSGGPMAALVQFGAKVYLSADATITTSNVLLGTINGGAQLGSGTAVTLACSQCVTVPTSVAPGNYYIGVIVDPNDWVQESDEANNGKADRIVNVVAGG